MINLTTAFNIFFWLTFIFFNFKFFTGNNNGDAWNFGYLAFMILIMWFVNQGLMTSLCNGNSNAGVISYATIPTWFIMFGLMLVIITTNTGWKSPFSNTFGYFLLVLSGYKTKLETHIKDNIDVKYNYIYKNPLIIINEFDSSNIEIAKTNSIVNNIFDMNNIETFQLITKLVMFKELVSEFIWFMLTGFIVISVSYNIISTNGCANTMSADEQKAAHDDAITSIPDGTQDSSRIYTITE